MRRATTRRPTGRRRGSGWRQGAVTTVWLFFANLFEPARAAATEQVDTQARIGAGHLTGDRAAAAPPAPPPPARPEAPRP